MSPSQQTAERQYLTPAEVAAERGVSADTVLIWINARQLVAADVSRGKGERPRWRIDRRDLDAFWAARRTIQPVATTRRAKSATAGKEYV